MWGRAKRDRAAHCNAELLSYTVAPLFAADARLLLRAGARAEGS